MNRINRLYRSLLKAYGSQGWWPLLDVKGTNPTKTGAIRGYHCADYSYPRTRSQAFEICAGAILTQNTAWPNVEKALRSLRQAGALDAKKIAAMDEERLGALIRPAGYFRQKAKKLKLFAAFFLGLGNRTPSRGELLALWGVGPETADSMRCYAFKQPEFVVDAYTRRIFLELGFIEEHATYDKIKGLVEKELATKEAGNAEKTLIAYQEFHALLVEHAKRSVARRSVRTHQPLSSSNRQRKGISRLS